MKKENLFYLTLIITILVIRISIILVPEVDIKLFNIVIHHFWFGLVLIAIGLLIPKQKTNLKLFIYAIGAGLVIDQLVFIILGAGQDKQYWGFPSLLGAIIIALGLFPIKQKITNFLLA